MEDKNKRAWGRRTNEDVTNKCFKQEHFGIFTEKTRIDVSRWFDPTAKNQVRIVLFQNQSGLENLSVYIFDVELRKL